MNKLPDLSFELYEDTLDSKLSYVEEKKFSKRLK